MAWRRGLTRRTCLAGAGLALGLAGARPARAVGTKIRAVGIENQYADVIRAIGGAHVSVRAIVSDPNTDPHGFEASPSVAAEIAKASLVVMNGFGYDAWARRIIDATGKAAPADTPGRRRPGRQVIDVRQVLMLPDSTPNPHVWYNPRTMPAVAAAVAAALAALDPAHAVDFRRRLAAFDTALAPWRAAIATFREHHSGLEVVVTEPVGNALLQAMGLNIATPWALQAAVMNGTDPAPQDLARQAAMLRGGQVRLLGYNRQVIDPLTRAMLDEARAGHVPVVGFYETMPAGFDYPGWMLAETRAIARAAAFGVSTDTLVASR